MHTTAYFLSSLIGSDRPTDTTTKAKFIMQISRGFPEKVNTIIAVLAELTKAMYGKYPYKHLLYVCIHIYFMLSCFSI